MVELTEVEKSALSARQILRQTKSDSFRGYCMKECMMQELAKIINREGINK